MSNNSNFSVPSDIKQVAFAFILASNGAAGVHPEADNASYDGISYSYYGNSLKFSVSETTKLIENFDNIDWDRTTEPRDTMVYGFAGTFADEQYKDYVMYQDVYFNDGTYVRICCLYESTTFGNILNGMLSINKSTEELLKDLEEKVTNPLYSYEFGADQYNF